MCAIGDGNDSTSVTSLMSAGAAILRVAPIEAASDTQKSLVVGPVSVSVAANRVGGVDRSGFFTNWNKTVQGKRQCRCNDS